jgi:NAD(P)-dependent dehydrogenase (short-subunit alcohol dehydrogenase family)
VSLRHSGAAPTRRRVIVNVSSVGGTRGMADAHAYAAAKAGVVNLTPSMARTYGPEQIRCNCFAPGVVDTGMIDPYRDTFEDDVRRPGRRRRSSARSAAWARWRRRQTQCFSWQLASYCNGTVLVMDGGSSA